MSCAAVPSASIAALLRDADCLSGDATSFAFAHLFGLHGMLTGALSILLTLYVALLAFSMLTGRGRLSALTPRAITLGLVLTFCTSWSAYQQVVWTLASGAPDQIATIVTGTNASASDLFARKLDGVFQSLSEIPADKQIKEEEKKEASGMPADDLVWVSALMMLLGTAGVMVTSKIVLMGLLCLGPIFVALALFSATRGLFEGWLKATVLFALAPLFAVVLGLFQFRLMAPLLQALHVSSDHNTLAVPLFLHASVFTFLMLLSLWAARILVGQWRMFSPESSPMPAGHPQQTEASIFASRVEQSSASHDTRISQIVAAASTHMRLAAPALAASSSDTRQRVRGLVRPESGS
ncbi:type IV secretion system protein VirB6 [Rhizomicrobium palustre]|uniref:Type IV secretion system protein VirB6 n=1 Tax=Rhizomicrobium palustre TaxID=189966 RepID=A0A846N2W9_9PROT|nr:type IV secretion system protein [Rhizomicrobium palustre]NIK89825.1 type IV secretion system protein VirB6 [Rhizomicrobium palustre]